MNATPVDPAAEAPGLDPATTLLLEQLVVEPDGHAGTSGDPRLRQRLLERVAHSVRAASVFHTVRGRACWQDRNGWGERLLYRHDPARPARRGEPLRVRVLELAIGARCVVGDVADGARCEWLVISGDADVDGTALASHDYHVAAAHAGGVALRSAGGAVLYLREALGCEPPGAQTQRAVHATWRDHAPGIERRVLWEHGDEAAMLYRVQPGAAVPRHGHGHDEECLMIDGEAFVDDILLRAGDYQLAPAGTSHASVSSDAGGLIYAHGDLELDLRG